MATAPKENTLKDVFSTTVTDCFVNQVATQLSDWLKVTKSVDVSREDICSAFHVPCATRPVMAGLPQAASMPTQMPNIPSYFQGTGVNVGSGGSPAPRSTRGGRKKVQVDPNAPKCDYLFQRGDKKGQKCGAPVSQDESGVVQKYCKNCLKKKTVQNEVGQRASDKNTVAPPKLPGDVSVDDTQSESESGGLNAIAVEGYDDLFKIVEHGFLVRRLPDGSLVAIAVEVNGVQRGLSADESRTALNLGLSLSDDNSHSSHSVYHPSNSNKSAPVQIPSIPSIPTIPAIPQVPSVSTRI